jgi:hypothetical protein
MRWDRYLGHVLETSFKDHPSIQSSAATRKHVPLIDSNDSLCVIMLNKGSVRACTRAAYYTWTFIGDGVSATPDKLSTLLVNSQLLYEKWCSYLFFFWPS